MSAQFGRWPWSWPVDVPARIRREDGTIYLLTARGTVYNSAASVGKGYWGRYGGPGTTGPPFELEVRVGRSWLRGKLRRGEWEVVPDAP